MSEIPQFTASVERNGTPVDFVSWKITRDGTKLAPSWEITLPAVMDISDTDLWTIKVGICGAEWTRIDNCVATIIGAEDGKDTSTRTIRCEGDIAALFDLRYFCVPKTYCFVNPDWLVLEEPTAFLENGVIKFGNRNARVAAGEGLVDDTQRFYHYRLPPKSMLEGTFECILGPKTHHAIAKYLANLVGYDLVATTPDINLIDTMTIQSGTKWGEAIIYPFSLWGTTVSVIAPTAANERPTILIVDCVSENSTVAGATVLKIDNPGIVKTSFSLNIERDMIDHNIIIGRSSKKLTIAPSTPDLTTVEVPSQQLDVTDSFTITTNIAGKDTGVSQDYTGFFGIPGTSEYRNPRRAVKQILTQDYYKLQNPKGPRYILVAETVNFYDAADVNVGREVIQHYHSPGYKPIKTIEKNYAYTNLPGSDTYGMNLLRVKCTFNDQFIQPLQQALTTEMIYDLVLYYWTKHTDGKDYRCSPAPMLDLIGQDYSKTAIPTSENSKADTLWMMTNIRKTEIFRTDDKCLIKRDYNYNILSEAMKAQSQILENPIQDKTSKQDDPLRWEFFYPGGGKVINGIRCYHPPKTIQHDDISDPVLAKKISDRIFYRRAIPNNLEVTINSPVPMPVIPLASIVRLAEFTRLVNGEEVTIPQADYVLKHVEESCAYAGSGNTRELQYSQTLKVRTRF